MLRCSSLDSENRSSVIKTLFAGIESTVLNSGNTSKFSHPSRGIRQGCPALLYLFNLVVQMLAILIKNNKDIKGLHMHHYEAKLSQFVDDLTCYLSDRSSLMHLLNTLQIFASWSGLKVNITKSWLLYPKGLAGGTEMVENIPV